jgi:adenylyltransferase/sulfurtransferase
VAEAWEITVSELKRLIDSGAHVNLIDVREPHEYALCHINGSRPAPLSQIPMALKELNPNEEYVFYCHVRERSGFVVNYLRHLGFRNVKNLEGGIDRWAVEIDRSIPRH